MSVSKKQRFEVFKRDGFQCAYCGKAPPDAMLEVDHINPKAKGGTDSMENLITACFVCNRGKRDTALSRKATKLPETIEILKLRLAQLKEYHKYCLQAQKHVAAVLNAVQVAASKIRYGSTAFQYFCGICWKKIKEQGGGNGQ